MTKEIASVKLHVYGTTSWGHNVDTHVTYHLGKSGCFDYGNGLAVHIEYESPGFIDDYIDARYDTRLLSDGSNFTDWVMAEAKARFDGNLKVMVVK